VNEGNHKFTMMIVPHSGKSTFSISVSILTLKIIGGLLATILLWLIIASLNFYVSYNRLKQDTQELQNGGRRLQRASTAVAAIFTEDQQSGTEDARAREA